MKKSYLIIFISFFACLSVFAFGGTINAKADEGVRPIISAKGNYVIGSGDIEFSANFFGLSEITAVEQDLKPLLPLRGRFTGDKIILYGEYLDNPPYDMTTGPPDNILFNIYGIKDGQDVEISFTVSLKTESENDDDPDPNENGDGGDEGENEKDNGGDIKGGENSQETESEIGGKTLPPQRTPNSTIGCNAAPFIFLPIALIGILKRKS